MKAILTGILLFLCLGFPARAMVRDVRDALAVHGTSGSAVVVDPFHFPPSGRGQSPTLVLYDANLLPIREQISRYQIVYAVGQVAHGALFIALGRR